MTDLQQINMFVKEINNENGRNYKIEVLKEYQSNDVIKKFLYFLFNPFLKTGISDKKIDMMLEEAFVCPEFFSIFDCINYICKYNTGRNEDIAKVQSYLKELNEEERTLAKKIITKNLQLGVETKTINKIFDDMIPTFDVQLANKYFDNPGIVEGQEFYVTTKIDGGRIILIKENGNVSCYTRAGQLYEGLVDIENEIKNFWLDNFVLDGEITLLDKGNLTSKDQYKQTMKITRKDGEKHGVKILAFDFMMLPYFKDKNSFIPYYKRRDTLEKVFKDKLKYVEVLPVLYHGHDTHVITKLLDDVTKNGEEGLMINLANSPYKFERCDGLLKVKKMQDIDLPIIGFEEGRNKHSNTLGAFLVKYKDNIVKVGSGISDDIRKEVWNNQDKYLGITIEIQYFEETENDKGEKSLRFPVFIDFRYDKPTF